MENLAKPSGITLDQHTQNVIAEGKNIIKNYPFVIEKYFSIVGKDLSQKLIGACKFHDVGKKHKVWQEACQKDYRNFLKWKEQNGGNFDDYQKVVKNVAPNLLKANIRHEIDSVIRCKKLPDNILVAIASHHGKLAKSHEEKWINNPNIGKQGRCFWQKFNRLNSNYTDRAAFRFPEVLQKHYEYAGIRGLLQLADHRASIVEENKYIPPFIPFEYKFNKNWNKRPVQQIAEENWKDDLLLIRAPTGSGKTDAALLWANQQIKNKRADRLIIAMPTRFTSNALAINVTDSLSETGLYHSSAWFQKFAKKAKENSSVKHNLKLLHQFARLLLTPVTVCTIDHLLMCLTLSREDHHLIAFDLAHSCVVIDEADFYDDFTQANILVLLEALKSWKVPVMIMSASLPASSLKMYQQIGYDISEIKEDVSDYFRPRCKVKEIREYEEVNDVSDLLNKCKNEPAIIYANTIDKAIEFYNWFIENSDVKPILYHSRFTEPDKLRKEGELLANLGKEAWERGIAKGVAILTQIGEMSINISADLMISDVCPIDRLVQRVGRLCRFDNQKTGELFILIPFKSKRGNRRLYPAPYGSLINKEWLANLSLKKTIDNLKPTSYSAKNFISFINLVYEDIQAFSQRAKNNAKLLKEQFAYNWIVLPKAQSGLDDSETLFWKSRDIGNTTTVLTNFPDNPYFNTYFEWQEYLIENSIDLPAYLIIKGKKMTKIYQATIFIKDDETKIWCVYEGVYDFDKGLYFANDDDNIF